MRIAVLTLTRDRLEYTRHCFALLEQHAGCDYDHYVLDQGSADGTAEWLFEEWLPGGTFRSATRRLENVGISPGMNALLHQVSAREDDEEFLYDAIVKFDNDCELTADNTLRDVVQATVNGNCLLSPRILGLLNPPQPTRRLTVGEEVILDVPQIGGIFLAAPAWVYDEFRYSDRNPSWGGDDVEICAWFRRKGGVCGYVERLEAWHYETTGGQRERFPDYFERKDQEFAAA